MNEIIKEILLPIVPILLSLYGLTQSAKALKKQLYFERKTASPCIILSKDEIILDNNLQFIKNEVYDGKSVNIELNILRNIKTNTSELFPTLIINFSKNSFSIYKMNSGENKRFLNHALLSIKNIGNPLIAMKIIKVEIIFKDDNEASFLLNPVKSTYFRFLDNNESFDLLVSFLFENDCDFIDCSSIPIEDIDKITNCAEHNVLNVHLQKIINKYTQMIFHFELTNQYFEIFEQKLILDSSNNTYKTWIEKNDDKSFIQRLKYSTKK